MRISSNNRHYNEGIFGFGRHKDSSKLRPYDGRYGIDVEDPPKDAWGGYPELDWNRYIPDDYSYVEYPGHCKIYKDGTIEGHDGKKFYSKRHDQRLQNDQMIDESYRPSCGSRLFESVMLRENLKKIADAFTAQINVEYKDQNIEQYGEDGLFIILLGDLVDKINSMHRRMDKGTINLAIRFEREDAQENVFNIDADKNNKLTKYTDDDYGKISTRIGTISLGELHGKLQNPIQELAYLVLYDLATTHKEFAKWINRNLDFVFEGLAEANRSGRNLFNEYIQNAKSKAKTEDDLELYTVKINGSTRVFSKSEIKANPKIQQILVAQLKSQGRWPQKQAASA